MASQLLNTVRELLSHIRNDSTHRRTQLSRSDKSHLYSALIKDVSGQILT